MKKKRISRTIYLIIMLCIIVACSMPSSIIIPITQNDAPVSSITSTPSPPSQNITPVKITTTVQKSDQNDFTVVEPVQEEIATLGQPVCLDDECLKADMVIDYLIVTRPYFVTSLEQFIDWKVQNGFRVGLVTVDWLDQNFEGRHMAERMKTGMHTIRKTSSSTEYLYVLLVGDTEIERDNFSVSAVQASYTLDEKWNVPTGFYRRMQSDPAGEVLASDAYFVEDRDWDPDNTGLNPVPFQQYGQGTFDATLYLGRWSVRRTHELENIIAKTIIFKPTKKFLIAQSAEFADYNDCIWPPQDYNGSRAYGTCYLNMNETISRLFGVNAPWLSTEMVVVDTSSPDDTTAFYDTLLNYDGAVYTSFHGLYGCIQIEDNKCAGIANFQFNSTIPYIELAACSVTAFYSGSNDTLTESLHNLPTGPIIVAGAGHDNYHFYENLRNGDAVGKAFWRAGATYVYWLNPMLLLGDPSLPIFVNP